MAHYAKISTNNIVEEVVVIANECEPTEEAGIAFCQELFGGGNWKKTSYNGSIRKNFAGPGYIYDPKRDAFIPPKPYSTWVFDEATCLWEPPVPLPDLTNMYEWDDITASWRSISN